MDNQYEDSLPDQRVLVDILETVSGPYAASDPELAAAIQRDIVMAASGQTEWEKDNRLRQAAAEEGLLERAFAGAVLRFRCSDSREEDAQDAARGSGVARSFRVPGGFLTDPDGELSDTVGLVLEQAGKDGNKVVEIEQHSSCGAMKIIYTYHMMKKGVDGAKHDGPEYITDHYGTRFAAMAKRRANLAGEISKHDVLVIDDSTDYGSISKLKQTFTTEEERQAFEAFISLVKRRVNVFDEVARHASVETGDFKHYTDMGLPLTHKDSAVNYQACMALQQGLWDYEATMKEHKDDNSIPEPLFLYRHISEGGWMFALDPATKKMLPLPHPDSPTYKNDLAALLERFPKQEMKDSLAVASVGMKAWMEENQLKMFVAENDMGDAQQPELSCVRSCDPRAEDPYHLAKGAGRMLSLRIVGPFMTEPGGELDHPAGQFMELCGAYKVRTLPIEMMNDSETMKVIYNYNKDHKGAAHVKKNYKKRFIRIAKRRAGLYNEVLKNVQAKDGAYDFSHYKELGVPLWGDEATKFQTCMTIQQGLWNLKAGQDFRAAYPKLGLPLPALFFKDVLANGATYRFGEDGKFIILPKMQDVKIAPKTVTRPSSAPQSLKSFMPKCGCGSPSCG